MPLPLTSIIFITDSRCIPFETKEDIDITSAAIGEWAWKDNCFNPEYFFIW